MISRAGSAIRGVVTETISLSLAGVLLWSSIAKALSPYTAQRFAYSLLPEVSPRLIVYFVCLFEIGVATLLVYKWKRRGVLLLLACAVCAFTAAFWLARSMGYTGGCGCFGGSRATQWREILSRNGLIMAAAAVGSALTLPVSPSAIGPSGESG
jgi:hypothetical protein